MKTRITFGVRLTACAIAIALPAILHGQQSAPMPDGHHSAAAIQSGTGAEPAGDMMMATKVADAEIDRLVQVMNAAEGAAKTEAIAALVTALVGEHRASHESMAAHMAACPMMSMQHPMMNMQHPMPGMMDHTPSGSPKP